MKILSANITETQIKFISAEISNNQRYWLIKIFSNNEQLFTRSTLTNEPHDLKYICSEKVVGEIKYK